MFINKDWLTKLLAHPNNGIQSHAAMKRMR